jgi:hypothetical protein
MAVPSPVDRLPKVGEVWRIPETFAHPPLEAEITAIYRDGRIEYAGGGYAGQMREKVFRASARFLREKPKARN